MEEISVPSNLPAWGVLLFLLALAAIAGVRLAINNYFAQKKSEFDLRVNRAKDDLETHRERNRHSLTIEFERQKAQIESSKVNDELIAQAMQQVTRFAESIQSINVMMFEEQAKASRERANLTALVIDQRKHFIQAVGGVEQLKTSFSGFTESINKRFSDTDDRIDKVMKYVRDIQEQLNMIHLAIEQYDLKVKRDDEKAAADTTSIDVE